MPEILIRVENLSKVFGTDPKSVMPLVRQGKSKDDILAETGHTVGLKDINLEIAKGEIFVIMGLSGSGKSTLIRHFNRLIDPTEGAIVVDGTDVMSLGQTQLENFRRHKMSMVFQRFGLLPHRTVVENVAYGLSVQGVGKDERLTKAREWLKTVGLEGYEDQYPSQLSGGQQQRVGLARALCTDPEVLLMDEAFSALDPLIRSGMQDQLIELQEKLHKTIVFITHDLDEALRLGDKIAILKDGMLSQVGRPEEILLHPADDYVEAFVRDVNRARVLSVDVVMKPVACRLTTANIDEALKQMRGWSEDYGYVFHEDEYKGVVTQEALEDACGQTPVPALHEMVEDSLSVQADMVIQEALPATLESPYPVPVLNDSGDFHGLVSRESMAEVFSEAPPEKEDRPAA
ncbi:glycine betaine/L-proline ABC transporter ATP-binding protein [Magnetospira sp. QH-2]|uniref:quaternary amine ABC transporter ATP-binding protein n=1 Tax=Magnetospira sp. (strain QH-2) TaxID=1288970 RepID=UPI0003E80F79|nr:glycine betaine/L-proline ABC transporter ATP-binding protein [Magnetospira sp. QH-2]CCQ73281.1 Glycine betaine transporter subunit; ATP-binding compoent of ABC superfamily [Magnetospira sp. QH-2]